MESYPVAILAGGLATRLRPVTETIPKSLISVAGKPFIIRQLAYLHGQGIRRVIICVGYLGEMIESLLGDGKQFGLNIKYSYDGPSLLGTGGAIKKALPLLEKNFFVLYGDSYLPIHFESVQKAFIQERKPVLITVFKNNNQLDISNVEFRVGRVIKYNKVSPDASMNHIDYGLAVLSASQFDKYSSIASFDLGLMYYELSIQNQLAGLEVYNRFYEIGSPIGLDETARYFLNQGDL